MHHQHPHDFQLTLLVVLDVVIFAYLRWILLLIERCREATDSYGNR